MSTDFGLNLTPREVADQVIAAMAAAYAEHLPLPCPAWSIPRPKTRWPSPAWSFRPSPT